MNWFVINPRKDDDEVTNLRKSDVNCGVKNYVKEDHRSCRRNFCSCEKKAWKKSPRGSRHPFIDYLLDLVVYYQLVQLIKEPTRVDAKSQTLIDVFITNEENSISHSGVYILSMPQFNLCC